jgi:hypothetical protein
MKSAILALAACLAAGFSGVCLADNLKAEQKFTDTQISFEVPPTSSNFTLTISGPNGIHASAASKSGAPSIDLRRIEPLDDGIYHYQLTASSDEKIPERSALNNGRGGPSTGSTLRNVSASGHFQVKGGTIVKFDPAAQEPQFVKRQNRK